MKALHLLRGQSAEDQAAAWLKRQGLKLVQRNYRCKAGEIDLIMQDNDVRVFVEVRYRSHANFGSAAESVTASKQRKLLRAAEHYLQRQQPTPACRFDIIGIDSNQQIQWIKNAFS